MVCWCDRGIRKLLTNNAKFRLNPTFRTPTGTYTVGVPRDDRELEIIVIPFLQNVAGMIIE
jgi:hypothetical protein